ncbi:pyridoxamine 5'-phosphate oxidase family protein, partial [Faecalibaculum rodentium]
MFREMRRKKQALDRTEIDRMHYGTNGVLALSGDEEYPYAVPISYVQDGDVLYFHCARSGHKLDLIRQNPKASFCVVDQDQIHP